MTFLYMVFLQRGMNGLGCFVYRDVGFFSFSNFFWLLGMLRTDLVDCMCFLRFFFFFSFF